MLFFPWSGRFPMSRIWYSNASRMNLAVLTVLELAGLSAAAQSFVPAATWTQQSPTSSPAARQGAMMAYDAAHGQVVLFGGLSTSGKLMNDTWIWNGSNWTRQSPANSPSVRELGMMACDPATSEVVLFGGSNGSNNLSDTWVWNGVDWTEASSSASPSQRNSATMAYDAGSGEIVLFGGFGNSGALNDTWNWNGTNWTQLSPPASPPARSLAAMTYDPASGQMVLFGGNGSSSLLSDTWTWNGTTWTQQSPSTSPGPRMEAGMSYQAAEGQVALFGGYTATTGPVDDTWFWDGANWTELSTAKSPSARDMVAMTYDTAAGQAVLFGGYSSSQDGINLGDTWTLQFRPLKAGTVTTAVASNLTAPWSASSQSVTLTVDVTAPGGPVSGGTLTIPAFVAVTTDSGTTYNIVSEAVAFTGSPAAFNLALPAGMRVGKYPLRVSYSPSATPLTPSGDNSHTLTITAPNTAPTFAVTTHMDYAGNATLCAPQSKPGAERDAACGRRDALVAAAAPGSAE
jgi:Galactose oxidase, central domain